MRRIAIVGAGQSGLQLGLGLLDAGYGVTIASNRTAQEIHDGPILSSQVMFDPPLQTERDQGLNFWDHECPWMPVLGVSAPGPDGGKLIDWACALDKPCQSLDQRVKFPRWMNEFEQRGGELQIREAGLSDLESYADSHDLVLVASGKGEIGSLFRRNPSRSPFDKPQRRLTLMFVKGMKRHPEGVSGGLVVVPGFGEYLYFHALTTTGECDIMLFEAVPGGPLDAFGGLTTPAEHLEKSKAVLSVFVPWEAARCNDIEPTDARALLKGAFPPTVKHPVGTLPSGRHVLGIGDAVVLNDPVTGRGANSAAVAASVYLRRILERGDAPFDPQWMDSTFEEFYDWAQWGVRFTNVQLQVPPADHIVQILMAGQHTPAIRKAFVEAFNEPRTAFPWIENLNAAESFIRTAMS